MKIRTNKLVYYILIFTFALSFFSNILFAKETIEFILLDIFIVNFSVNNMNYQYSVAVGLDDNNKRIGYIVEWKNLSTKQGNVTVNYNSFTNNNVNLLFSLMQSGLFNEIKKQIGKFIIIENNTGFNFYDKKSKDPIKLNIISTLKLDLLYEIKGRNVSNWYIDNFERILILQTSVKNASIYINDKFVGLSPLKLTFKGRVTVKIRAEKEGYETKEMVLTLKKTGENKIFIDLGEFDNLDRIIKIRCYPSFDANVFYNDIPIGHAPITHTIKGKTSGIITLKKNNISTSIYFDGSKNGEYEINLYFDAEPRKIEFLSTTKDSVLFLNGKSIDFLPYTLEYFGEKYFIGQIKSKTKISPTFLVWANPNESKFIKVSLDKYINKNIKKFFYIILNLIQLSF